MMVVRIVFFATILFNFTSSNAQEKYNLVTEKGVWFPAPVKGQRYQSGAYYGYTTDQQKAMFANMARIMELIHQTPFLNPPKGYEVGVFASLCSDGCDRGKAITGRSGMIIREYFTRGNDPKIERAGEGPSLKVYFNDINILLTRTPPGENSYFEEPKIVSDINGFPIYEGGFLVITKNQSPLFVPITKEQVLNISIKERENSLERIKKEFSKGSAYSQWVKNKDQNIKDAMFGFDMLAKSDPQKAKTEREKYLRGMAQMDSTMKADEATNLKEQRAFVTAAEKNLQDEKNKLASMTEAEKKSPEMSENGRRMVVANKAFFKSSVPVSDLQLLVLDFYRHDVKGSFGSLLSKQAIKSIRETVDYAKLLGELK